MTRLDPLFRHIASEEDALRAGSGIEERLVARVRQFSPARRARRARVLPLVAAVAMLAVGLGIFGLKRSPTLAVTVGESGAPPLGAWLGAPEQRTLPLEFSDGSRFELTPGSRARLVEVGRHGARVELGNGSLKVHVAHQSAAAWRLDAGPFGVRITGTRFDVSYSPESGTFELFLEDGQVELTGCAFGKGRPVAAGQSVRASCKDRVIDVSYGRRPRVVKDEARTVPTAPLAAGSAATRDVGPASSAGVDSNAAHDKPANPNWLALAKAGSYEEAFTAARAQGFETECARASPDALALLADVARHAGASRQAEHALLTLRRRFPGTADAALAAFALGRLEFDERRAYGNAATWFRTCLSERPSGPMAREALGRLVEALHRTGNRTEARAVAARYLGEYPSGPHAELASRILAMP